MPNYMGLHFVKLPATLWRQWRAWTVAGPKHISEGGLLKRERESSNCCPNIRHYGESNMPLKRLGEEDLERDGVRFKAFKGLVDFRSERRSLSARSARRRRRLRRHFSCRAAVNDGPNWLRGSP